MATRVKVSRKRFQRSADGINLVVEVNSAMASGEGVAVSATSSTPIVQGPLRSRPRPRSRSAKASAENPGERSDGPAPRTP